MSTLKAALIGYGYAGKTIHAPLLAHTPGIELAAIVSSKAAAACADWPQARPYTDAAALYADGVADLVVIATPNDTHFPLAQAALQAGCHVVVDKPFTATLDEARTLLALAESRGLILSVFQNRRWDADFLTLKALLERGEAGRVVQFESRFDRYRPEVRQRWREQPGLATGIWYDLGPHLADQVLQLFGRPEAVFADLAVLRDGAGAVDHFNVLLRYADKRVTLRGGTLVSGGAPRFALHGTRASYVKYGLDTQETMLKEGKQPGCPGWGCDPVPGTLIRQADGRELCSEVPMLAGDYRRYYAALAATVASGTPNPVSAQEAIDVMTLIELAAASAAKRRELCWPAD